MEQHHILMLKCSNIPVIRNAAMLTFETTLHLEEREKVIQQRIERYFEEQRYQAKLNADNQPYYERGSVWRNYVAFNPADWHVLVWIKVLPVDQQSHWVQVRLDVDTQGQYVLERERHYWQTEFEVLTGFLETGKTKREDVLGQLGKSNEWKNIWLTASIFTVSIAAMFVLVSALMNAACFC
jgi:hypothetical protein